MPVDLLLVLVVILAVVLMWRGPKTLPKLGEALGRGVREARTEAVKAQEEIEARTTGEPEPVPPANVAATPGPSPASPGAVAGDVPTADPNRPA